MSGRCLTLSYPSFIRRLARGCRREPSQLDSGRRHLPTLNDDVLLNIFYQYRLGNPDEYEDENGAAIYRWDRQRWWYTLAHVCQLWRNIILGSPSHLDIHLFCTNGVPVADMLAHSPPLPLTVYYHTVVTADDESGIFLALSHRDRVHRIYFWMLANLEKFVTVMDGQFPILKSMYIRSQKDSEVDLPVTFQAPNLRHFKMMPARIPIQSPLLTTVAGLVTLELRHIPASTYFPPSYILTRLSLMPQLENLFISFQSPVPNRDVERQSSQTQDMTTLPNLLRFIFRGTASDLEGLVDRISAPSLNKLHVLLCYERSFTFPRLLQFMHTSKNLRFTAVQVTFSAHAVFLHTVPWKWDTPLRLVITCGHLDSQVASAAQLIGALSPILSVVEKVTFGYKYHDQSSELHNDVDQMQWRDLLRPFINAKTIHVQHELVEKIFRSLTSDAGYPTLELLPNLEEVGYSGGLDSRDALAAFVNARWAAGHPVSLREVDPSIFLVDLNQNR